MLHRKWNERPSTKRPSTNLQSILQLPPNRGDQGMKGWANCVVVGDGGAEGPQSRLGQTTIAAIGPSPIHVKILGSTLGKKDGYAYFSQRPHGVSHGRVHIEIMGSQRSFVLRWECM